MSRILQGPYSPGAKGNAAEAEGFCKVLFCWAVREYLPDCHVYVERYRRIRPASFFVSSYFTWIACIGDPVFLYPTIFGKFKNETKRGKRK